MVTFSNDSDILKYEPILFGDLHLANQVLASGTGAALTGTTFTAAGSNFIDSQVQPGGVIYLRSADGLLDGSFEIISIDSETQLTISVLRADENAEAIAPPAANEITYRICTYAPQAAQTGSALCEHFNLSFANSVYEITVEDVIDKNVLKRPSVFAVLSNVYAILSGGAKNENFWQKSLHYQELSEKEKQKCRLSIDTNSDGQADVTRGGSSFRLVRD